MKRFVFLAILLFLSTVSLGICEKATQDLGKLSQEYAAKSDYDGFYQYLNTLPKTGEVYFYLADVRQQQIQYWQKTKNWEGVYDKAQGLKKEILANLDRAERTIKNNPAVFFKIKYDRWSVLKDEDPDRAAKLFNDLVAFAKEKAGDAATLKAVKEIADACSKLEDKNLSRRLYEIYVAKISSSNLTKEERKSEAEKFLEVGNLFLAKSFYEAYLNPLTGSRDLLAKAYVEVADKFASPGTREGLDPFYAESLYQKAYDMIADKAFDSGSQYRRAFNLERMKEFEAAFAQYKNLLSVYPDYENEPEILFRLGVLAAYALRDVKVAEGYFHKIVDNFPKDGLSRCGLYQMGLLSQWSNDTQKAKEFYTALLDKARDEGVDADKDELVLMTKDRLSEIEEKKEMPYALKLFLEGVFKKGSEKEALVTVSVDLTAQPSKGSTGQEIKYTTTTSSPQTGCMTPAYSYEWSGEVGTISNIPNSPELTTAFSEKGVKVTHVAVIGPQGLEGVGFEMAQIKDEER